MTGSWRTLGVVLLALTLGFVTACGGSDDASGPPEIVEGRTICDECGMIIDEIRFAASYRTVEGDERVFDDIGGMLVQGHRDGVLTDAEIWVHDFESTDVVPAPDATYVLSGEVVTPMAWGVLAFASAAAAEELAADIEGTVIGWDGLVERSAVEGLVPALLHDHDDDTDPDDDEMDHDMNDSDEGERQ